jgi:hypothetical protein
MKRIVPHSSKSAGGKGGLPGPTLTFAFVVATLIGAVFHVFAGGDARRFALFLLAAWFGFGLGHVFGASFGFGIFAVGTLQMGSAIAGAMLALLLARYLTANRRLSVRASRTR